MSVPEGWKKECFGDIASFKNGLNFTKSDSGDSITIVGVGDFKDYSELRSTSHLETVQVSDKVRDSELLQSGDLLFVRSNGNKALIGRCLYFPSVAERLSFSGFTIRGRVNKNKIKPEYAAYLARSSIVKSQFSRNGGGTNISNLSQQILSDVVFNLPPIPEQKKIARILSTWDRAIEVTEKLLKNSQQQKKALMQQLLTGKKRLPGFSGEWIQLKVGDILRVRNEKQIPSETTPLFSLTIENGITAKTERYNREFLVKNSDEKKYKLVKPNDIAYNPANLRWGAINYSRLTHNVVVSPIYEILYVKDVSLNNLHFMAQVLMSDRQIAKFASMIEGTLMERKAVKIQSFLATKISIPSELEEQQAIASVLSTADKEIEILEQKLGCLRQEKKALMQQLLTGKRRAVL